MISSAVDAVDFGTVVDVDFVLLCLAVLGFFSFEVDFSVMTEKTQSRKFSKLVSSSLMYANDIDLILG